MTIMSKTDGLILNRIFAMPDEKLIRFCFAAVIIWIISPIAALLSNLLGIDGYNFCGVWLTFLYVSGALGLIFGGLFLFKMYSFSDAELRAKLMLSEPLILVGTVFLWAVFCTLFAGEKTIAIYGYEKFHDNLFVYLFYGGMITAGIAVKNSEKYLLKSAEAFLCVAASLSFVSLVNNGVTNKLCRNSLTETDGHEAVFFDTEHFAMYLVMAIIVCAFLVLRLSKTGGRIIVLFALGLMVAALAFTGSLAGLIALALVSLFTILRYNKLPASSLKVLLLELSVCLVVYILIVSVFKVVPAFPENMLVFWRNTLKKVGENAVVGIGPQNTLGYAYNVYLKICLYLGVPGLLLYLAAFITAARELISQNMKMPLYAVAAVMTAIGYVIFAFFGSTMFYTAPYFYIVIGIIFGKCLEPLGKTVKVNCDKN